MYKWLTTLIVIVVLADPGMAWLNSVGEMKDGVMAAMFSIVAVPWVVSHFDS
jgi:hypothetical protein